MSLTRSFTQVNVFSSHPFKGNPVAVVLDGQGLSAEEMQEVAIWINLSETTFVLPPSVPDADYAVRIFTPGGELPFAGHPTLGTAHAWLEHGGAPQDPTMVIQECLAGLVQVKRGDHGLAFAAPPTKRDGPLDDAYLADVARAFGIERTEILAHQWVDNGPGWAVVQLPSAEAVLALEPDLSQIPNAMIGALGVYPAGSPTAYELRTFAPALGITEDPVCGSMNASVAQWMIKTDAMPSEYRVSQGSRVGRHGEIEISADQEGNIWIGGATISCIRGEILL